MKIDHKKEAVVNQHLHNGRLLSHTFAAWQEMCVQPPHNTATQDPPLPLCATPLLPNACSNSEDWR